MSKQSVNRRTRQLHLRDLVFAARLERISMPCFYMHCKAAAEVQQVILVPVLVILPTPS